jgi:DNA-directed RNA polymerase subunit beta'
VEALTRVLNIEAPSTGRALRVNKVWIDDTLDAGDFESQRQAVRNDKTWGVPVYAALDLVDTRSGKVLSKTGGIRVATLPKGTDLGSFIVGGQHYQMHNQLRRKPGIYITRKNNRDLKTEVHVARRPFDIEYSEESGVFSVKKGQASRPLYPLLSRMGISDGLLSRAWGADVLQANKNHQPNRQDASVKKLAKSLTGETFDSATEAAAAVADALHNSELDPALAKRTLGQAHDRVTPEALVHATGQLLKAIRGERPVDERESLENKKILSVSDFLRNRFFNDEGGLSPKIDEFRSKVMRRLGNRMMPPTQVGRVISSNEFTPLFESMFTQGGGLSHVPEQTNPLHMLNGISKVTITGEGGIQNEQGIKQEDRGVHPSHMGFIDPIHTPDSASIGVVNTLPIGVTKDGNELKTRVYDPRNKSYRYITPVEAMDSIMALPDQFRDGKPIAKRVKAMVNGEMRIVDASTITAVLASPKQAFSISSNTIPFLPSAQGVRAQMATKMLEQAMPLARHDDGSGREAPLVQVALGKGTVEQGIGEGFSIRALDDGVVDKITGNKIIIKTKDGVVEQPIYNNLPLNMKSFLHAEPRVKVGDKIKKGAVLADSNFTDKGVMALGTNLRAAYVPYKGWTIEDGIVITETAAKKLTSEHMYQFAQNVADNMLLSGPKYFALEPNQFNAAQRNKLNDDGVIKKGQIVRKGDPLWVGVKDSKTDPDSIMVHKFTGGRMRPWAPFKEIWDGDSDGEVIDVVRNGDKVKVYVKTRESAQVGDKLTARHGNKGIITKIIPDGQAPYTVEPDGTQRHVEILLNPHGIVTRMNPSQILETAAAKVAEKTGKPYVVENFSGEDYVKKVSDDLAKHGIKDKEVLIDPLTNKPLGEVLVGPQYILKIKQATSAFSARSEGKYDANRAPLKGGDEGSKAVDMLTFHALIGHGARANLREMATYKASKNEPFWTWLQGGPAMSLVKPPPEPTFAYKKFETYLKGAGVDIKRSGSKMTLQPITDREVTKMSSGAVSEPLFLRAKDLQRIKGGLVDPLVFGSNEDRWGHIDLAEPIPNPIFEKPILALTGLNNTQFHGLLKGTMFVDPATGEWNTEGQGITGGEAVKHLLSQVNVDEQVKEWTEKAKTANAPAKLDLANKRLKYLTALKKLKLRPEDAYIQTKLPVIPPQFRPLSPLPDGQLSTAGVNFLYRDLGLINNELKWQKSVPFIPEAVKAELRENLYEGAKALYGLSEPIAFYPQTRRPKGFVEQIRGKPAKRGFFQYEVLRRKQNLVGRGTIIPEPKLGVDEVGLPEEMAWNIFKPFVVRHMVAQMGRKPLEAIDEVDKKRTPAARAALDAVMAERPVLLNRAPSLHKFSIMAFKPQITEGRAVRIPPLVIKGFNADFDGDAMTVHVPILPDAVEEAKNMLPSKHLYNPGTGAIMIMPQNESALGLYMLSQHPEGRKIIMAQVPESIRAKHENAVLDKKGLTALMNDLAEAEPRDYGKVVGTLKSMGDEYTYRSGFTVGLKDLSPDVPERKQILDAVHKAIADTTGFNFEKPENREAAVKILQEGDKKLGAALKTRLAEQGNAFHLMVHSGARGNPNQLKQVVSTPFLTADHLGAAMPIPVTHSFSEGLPFSEYWNTLYGGRAAAIDKQLQTQNPGAFTKDILASAATNVISTPDCKTTKGITLSVQDQGRDIEDRFLAHDVSINGTVIAKAGEAVNQHLLNALRERHVKEVEVRSPLTCKAPHGTCSKCYGIHDNGQLPAIGENVGALSGQALSEPLTQMVLRTFHSGGAVGSRGVISGYEKIDKLLTMHEIKKGRATLARHGGKIEKIEPVPGGAGRNVFIGQTKHFVAQDLFDSKLAKVGNTVAKGDAISSGLIQPQELADLKGMLPAQQYIVDQVQEAYKEQNVDLKRRAIETVMRSVGNTTRVLDPGHSDYLAGDVAPFMSVEEHNQRNLGKKALHEVHGHVLREDVGNMKAGTVIDDQIHKALERLGKTEVEVGPRPIIHKPFLTGVRRLPIMRDDWMAQLGYRELEKGIIRGANESRTTDIHGYSPIPAYAYGAEFGDAPGGKSRTEGVY